MNQIERAKKLASNVVRAPDYHKASLKAQFFEKKKIPKKRLTVLIRLADDKIIRNLQVH